MATKLKEIPKGYRIIKTPSGNYLQEQKQRRKRYKTPAKTRQRIATSLRRFKIPVLTSSALIIGTWDAFESLQKGGTAIQKARLFGYHILKNYTGVHAYFSGEVKWKPSAMLKGLVPLAAVMIINRSGLLKPVNQKLARARIPLRLS